MRSFRFDPKSSWLLILVCLVVGSAIAIFAAKRRSEVGDPPKGLQANIGGVPVDLNSGMIEAVTNPPQGFVFSAH